MLEVFVFIRIVYYFIDEENSSIAKNKLFTPRMTGIICDCLKCLSCRMCGMNDDT